MSKRQKVKEQITLRGDVGEEQRKSAFRSYRPCRSIGDTNHATDLCVLNGQWFGWSVDYRA